MAARRKSYEEESLLVIIFAVLAVAKLLDWIDWSWWWVTLPLWIVPGAHFLAVVLSWGLVLVLMAVMQFLEFKRNGWRRKP